MLNRSSSGQEFDFMRVDFRFINIENELFAINRHIDIMEAELIRFTAEASAQLASGKWQSEELEYQRQRIQRLLDVELPLFFRGPIIICLWAIFESGTQEIADKIASKRECSKRLSQMQGNAIIRRLNYFRNELEFPLVSNETDERFLKSLYTLRNSLAHNNGRLDANHSSKEAVGMIVQDIEEVTISWGYLHLHGPFVRRSFSIVNRILNDLIFQSREILGV